jgi:SAM-dependent methyltransferase
MDDSTLLAYDGRPRHFCDDWLSQPEPADIQGLWQAYFTRGEPSADIGSGSGRDVDWLNRHGYPCVGFDASAGLRAEASARFPRWRFLPAMLPELAQIHDGAYGNVVCETVLMHLPAVEVPPAVRSLIRILAPGGTLYLSWRVTEGIDVRDGAGRLYSAFAADAVRNEIKALPTLYDREEVSQSSGRRVQRLIVRRG